MWSDAYALQALTFIPGAEPQLVEMFKRWGIAYSKTLMCHLRDDHDVRHELQVHPIFHLKAAVALDKLVPTFSLLRCSLAVRLQGPFPEHTVFTVSMSLHQASLHQEPIYCGQRCLLHGAYAVNEILS